jgi:hypothetical protein
VGYVELRSDLAWYLERPEAFGRFYVVARLYSAAWGAIGAGLIFVIVRRLTRDAFASFCAAIAFAALPVVVTAAHEAKPHLAGAVLMLWAVLKADDFVQGGRRRDGVWAGLLCGAASAMVVSMVVSFAVLPVMGLLRWRRERIAAASGAAPGSSTLDVRRSTFASPSSAGPLATIENVELPTSNAQPRSAGRHAWVMAPALVAGVLVYAATNPWVIYHVLFDRAIFRSNIGNTTAMYGARDIGGSFLHGLMLLAIAAGAMFAVAVVTALLVFAGRRKRLGARSWLLVTAGAAVLIYFFPLSGGKPAEYARFGIVPMAVLVIAFFAVAGRGLFPLAGQRRWLSLAGVLLVAVSGVPYVVNFVTDSGPHDTRTRTAERLALSAAEQGASRLKLWAEPAPWSSPPFDLWLWEAVLDTGAVEADAAINIAEDAKAGSAAVTGPFITPISWANKPFAVRGVPAREAASSPTDE